MGCLRKQPARQVLSGDRRWSQGARTRAAPLGADRRHPREVLQLEGSDVVKRVRRFLHRLLASITRADRDDFEAELDAHLTLLTEDNIRRGLSPEAARREARLRLGGTSQISEYRHDQ